MPPEKQVKAWIIGVFWKQTSGTGGKETGNTCKASECLALCT